MNRAVSPLAPSMLIFLWLRHQTKKHILNTQADKVRQCIRGSMDITIQAVLNFLEKK